MWRKDSETEDYVILVSSYSLVEDEEVTRNWTGLASILIEGTHDVAWL